MLRNPAIVRLTRARFDAQPLICSNRMPMNVKKNTGKPLHVFFHVGYEKTGTTSIQNFLRKNQDALREQGFLYPLTLGRISQVEVVKCCKAEGKVGQLIGGESDPYRGLGFNDYRREIRHKLHQEILASGCQNVIVSSEHVSIHFNKPEDFERFRELFADFDARFTVIVYLRDQVSLLESRTYTMIVAGAQKVHEIEPGSKLGPYLDYLSTIERLDAAFGTDRLIVRIFDRAQMEGGDVVTDFLSVTGLKGLPAATATVENSSVGIAGMKVLARANSRLQQMDRRQKLDVRKRLLDLLHAVDTSPRFRLSPEAADYVRRTFRAGNAEVARRYLGRNGDLFESRRKAEGEPPEPLKPRAVQDLLVDLLLAAIDSEPTAPRAGRARKTANRDG